MSADAAQHARAMLRDDADALAHIGSNAIAQLTAAATEATFYGAPLSADQIAANQRIPAISTPTCWAAAASANQSLSAAFIDEALAGYVIATRHSADDLELDWLMVHPNFHGAGVGAALMARGIAWLGAERPIWLSVIAFNQRAIAFYEKFGFAIDHAARTAHIVPHHIMRRA